MISQLDYIPYAAYHNWIRFIKNQREVQLTADLVDNAGQVRSFIRIEAPSTRTRPESKLKIGGNTIAARNRSWFRWNLSL